MNIVRRFICTKKALTNAIISSSEFGSCKFWGDPHGLTFDKSWLHFQGSCSYVMATDGCQDLIGLAGSADNSSADSSTTDVQPLFRVIQDNWKGIHETSGHYSWIRQVHLHTYGHVSSFTWLETFQFGMLELLCRWYDVGVI